MENSRVSIESSQPIVGAIDLGLESDYKLGILIADAKITATQQAYDDRYSEGVASFFKTEITPEDDRLMGRMAASIALEERRKTLIEVSIRSTGYSIVSVGAALLVGFSPVQSVVCLPVSVVIAICTGGKHDRSCISSGVCADNVASFEANKSADSQTAVSEVDGEPPFQE